jgi:BMFP domain-containing protein YqiC
VPKVDGLNISRKCASGKFHIYSITCHVSDFALHRAGAAKSPRTSLGHHNGAQTWCTRSPARLAASATLEGNPTTPLERAMIKEKIFDEIAAKVSEAIANSPAKDVEKNIKAMMGSAFTKMDLVTREEFDIQQDVLARTRETLTALEARVAALEEKLLAGNPQDSL